MWLRIFLSSVFVAMFALSEARLPEIDANGVKAKIDEMLRSHATHKKLDDVLVKRILLNYLELLDPSKVYLIQSDVSRWTDPNPALIQQILSDYKEKKYTAFSSINETMQQAILRRRQAEKTFAEIPLPGKVNPEEFKELSWVPDEKALIERLLKIRRLQRDAVEKLEPELQPNSLQRIAKRQTHLEDEILNNDPSRKQLFIYSNVLKATAAALDAHTSYFTPDEAAQFMISVQQRLFGIGAQLRDDINGFTITKIVEGGPAAASGLLKVKDKIIAVNGEPVVGMDITEAVELIRGEENSPVKLTILREVPATDDEEKKTEQKLDVSLHRGEVVIQEARYESSFEPFGNGIIGYFRLHSFYQDPEHSSTEDLAQAIKEFKKEGELEGLILDLRGNTGGLLTQAVGVTGLFIHKGVIVSIRDEMGKVQHLRDLDGKTVWEGPLIVLIDRASASASEIVAQSLQDFGRALIVGDDHSYGKGSFQTFTLNVGRNGSVNPKGEYKVTRGIYYTVSGKTPQLVGVQSDIPVASRYSQMEIGEKHLKYALENDHIPPNFEDKMLDLPPIQRQALLTLYGDEMQAVIARYTHLLPKLKKNSEIRLKKNQNYQKFLEEISKKSDELNEEEDKSTDFQLNEAYNIIKDEIVLLQGYTQ